MSHTKNHFLALLPLMAILSSSPAQIMSRSVNRSIATVQVYPKYEARAGKINREALYKNPEIDLTAFSEKADKYREQLMRERQNYQTNEVDPDKVKAQKARIDELVIGLVLLEEDNKIIKEKKLRSENGEQIFNETLNELLVTLESLLVDERENEFFVLQEKVKKDEDLVKVTEEKKKEEEEVARTEVEKQEKEDKECEELSAENKVLTDKVESLVSDNAKIMEMMMGLLQMMIKNQSSAYLPYLTGPQVSSQLVFPQSSVEVRYYPEIIYRDAPDQQAPTQYQNQVSNNPQMGNRIYQQNSQNEGLYFDHQFSPIPRYDYVPGNTPMGEFGGASEMYHFGPSEFNVPELPPVYFT